MRAVRKPTPEVLDLLADCSPGVSQLALALRELVLAEAPEAEEVLYSVYAQVIVFRIPGRKHGAFCSVVVYTRHVNLHFYRGASMPDPQRALTGPGKQMRHIRVDSPDDLRRPYLSAYIRSALETIGPPTQPKKRSR